MKGHAKHGARIKHTDAALVLISVGDMSDIQSGGIFIVC